MSQAQVEGLAPQLAVAAFGDGRRDLPAPRRGAVISGLQSLRKLMERWGEKQFSKLLHLKNNHFICQASQG